MKIAANEIHATKYVQNVMLIMINKKNSLYEVSFVLKNKIL